MPKSREVVEQSLRERAKRAAVSRPLIFDLGASVHRTQVKKLFAGHRIQHVIDDYVEEQRELFSVRNPAIVSTPNFEKEFEVYFSAGRRQKPLSAYGRWVYFPWRSTLVHVLDDKEFQLVRTARNRDLITKEEQEKFYEATIGIAGLSVGNSVALAIVLQGGGRRIRLADHDRLALSNMNRVRAGVENLGLSKVELTARQIYEMDPYAKIELFPQGLNEKNIKRFFRGPPKLDVVIDEIDNLAVKFLIREQARKWRVPVVMAADNGDNGVVDIERYDLNPKTRFFHGRMGKVTYIKLKNLDKFGIGRLITKQVGPENVTERMQQSLLEIGKTIVSWPQLGGAALLNGAAVAYCVRKIVNRQPLERNRAFVSLDEKLVPSYQSFRAQAKREGVSREFRKLFGL